MSILGNIAMILFMSMVSFLTAGLSLVVLVSAVALDLVLVVFLGAAVALTGSFSAVVAAVLVVDFLTVFFFSVVLTSFLGASSSLSCDDNLTPVSFK